MLTRKALAQFLTEQGFPITAGTLSFKASAGGGPPYRRFGNKTLYDPAKALEWATARAPERTSTSTICEAA